MILDLIGYISLPPGDAPAAYGRPALHQGTGRLYLPMTDDDALGVVDCLQDRYLHTIPNLPGAGAVVAPDQADILLAVAAATSEVVVIEPGPDRVIGTLTMDGTPQELAYDPIRGHLLVSFAGEQQDNGHFRIAVVDVRRQYIIGAVRVPAATRQVLYDHQSDQFYVVIADPAQIMVLDAADPTRIAYAFDVAVQGLRSIAVGPQGIRLFCACDDSSLVTVDRRSGRLLSRSATGGLPDTILYNPLRGHLYVAVGERGIIEVFDTVVMTSLGARETEPGARHFAVDQTRDRLYALLPESRRVAVYEDGG